MFSKRCSLIITILMSLGRHFFLHGISYSDFFTEMF